MKHLSKLLLLCMLVILSFTRCSESYDDSELRGRIENIEEWQKDINSQINTIKGLITALENKDFVTSVTELSDKSGYTINFSKSPSIIINKNINANTSIVSVRQDEDGIYYWIVNNEWMVIDGKKVRASANDGITPQIRINKTNSEWEISTDEGKTWIETGVKAKGNDGDSFFESVTTKDNVVELKLKDNTIITLPLNKSVNFKIGNDNSYDVYEVTNTEPFNLPINFLSEVKSDAFRSIIVQVISDNIVTRCSEQWEVVINKPTLQTNNNIYNNDGYITLTPSSSFRSGSSALLRVIFVDKKGNEITSSRVIKNTSRILQEGESVTLDKTEIIVPKEGGTFDITITSPIPVYTEQIYGPNNGYQQGFYEGDPVCNPSIDKSIKNNILTIKVGKAQRKNEQNISVDLYDCEDNVVASVILKVEGNPSCNVPLLGNYGKQIINATMYNLTYAYRGYSYLEQFYIFNKVFPQIPFPTGKDEVSQCWGNFFDFNSRILNIKQSDKDMLGCYEDYINVFYSIYYYTMVIAWGDVPYNYGNKWELETNIPRIGKDKILSDLKVKLTESINNLNEKKNESTKDINGLFFVSKDVARIALANIYMYEKEWGKAQNLLSKVISNNFYKLDSSDDNNKDGNGVILALFLDKDYGLRSRSSITIPNVIPLQTITDVYLSSAECEYHLNHTTEANSLLSKVTSAKNITVSSNGLTGIKEARKELLLYSTGYFAFLKRNDLAKTECGIEDYQLLFPIPQNEIYKNPYLTQNPGY